jgi:predicted dithiol-disulfide oxidoreductase (DUF899 family)
VLRSGGRPQPTTFTRRAAQNPGRMATPCPSSTAATDVVDALVGSIAAVKLDVVFAGRGNLDHLLLLRTKDGWRIAAAAWGDPAPTHNK